MRLRKLDVKEHEQTRALWELVFKDDSRAFLDYYYFIKIKDNEIHVIEEDDGIRTMLHLNPYEICINENVFPSHYIVAVATQEEYRKRGYMGILLQQAMTEMYQNKEPFTFLMPAAEAIYTPYDFRFIYDQVQTEFESAVSCANEKMLPVELREARLSDTTAMTAFFAEHFAAEYQLCAVHDEKYYQTMILEQQSQDGGVKLLTAAGKIVGMYAYSMEMSQPTIREPLYLAGYEDDFLNAVNLMKAELQKMGSEKPLKILACLKKLSSTAKPMIMARILHLPTMLAALTIKDGMEIDCSFAVLDAFLPQNSKVWKLESYIDDPHVRVKEAEDSEGVLTIAALTSLLFGYKSVAEIAAEPDVVITDKLGRELNKLQFLQRIFLNEIV